MSATGRKIAIAVTSAKPRGLLRSMSRSDRRDRVGGGALVRDAGRRLRTSDGWPVATRVEGGREAAVAGLGAEKLTASFHTTEASRSGRDTRGRAW